MRPPNGCELPVLADLGQGAARPIDTRVRGALRPGLLQRAVRLQAVHPASFHAIARKDRAQPHSKLGSETKTPRP